MRSLAISKKVLVAVSHTCLRYRERPSPNALTLAVLLGGAFAIAEFSHRTASLEGYKIRAVHDNIPASLFPL